MPCGAVRSGNEVICGTATLTRSTTRNIDRQREQLEAFTAKKPLSAQAVKTIAEEAKGRFFRKYLKVREAVFGTPLTQQEDVWNAAKP